MNGTALFSQPALMTGAHLAEVVSVQDPDNLGRVQVRLLGFDGVTGQDAPVWARVAVPFAGSGRGAFLIPDVGDEVVVTFINGDSRWPIIVGGLWNGSAQPPESLPGSRVDRWTLVGKAGTRIAIVEETSGQETISFETPSGVTGTLTDQAGGKIVFKAAGTTVTLDSSGLAVKTGATVKVDAAQVEVKAGMVNVETAMAKFSGIVKCEVLKATTVVAETYTTGAGNVW